MRFEKSKEWYSKKDLYVILVFKVSFLMFNDGLQTKFEKEKIYKIKAPTVHRVPIDRKLTDGSPGDDLLLNEKI